MKKTIIYFFFMVLLVFFVSGEKVQTNIYQDVQALTIVYPKEGYYQSGVNINLSFDVLNSSYNRLDNTQTNCSFIYENTNGQLLEIGKLKYSEYWFYPLNNTQTANIGTYAYYVHCNASNEENGYLSNTFEITETGEADKENTGTADLAIMIFILSIAIGCFVAASKKGWSKNVYADLILKRSFSVLGLYFMVLNSAIAATIAVESGLPLASEMFGYMFILGIVGWLAMAYLVLRTFFDLFNTWKIINNEKRFG